MKKSVLIACFCVQLIPSLKAGTNTGNIIGASPEYWQQELHYDIRVTLNDSDHSLNGFESIEYINHSPDTLSFIWFHLWPNAYKNKTTAYYKQIVEIGTITGKQRANKDNGYIDSLNFTIDGQMVKTEADPKYIDIIKIILPKKMLPGTKILISTPFMVKIPRYFSRMGFEGSTFMITQWYPKPAVYDRLGWHPIPYLDQGEFYSEYGSFDVHITLPSSYVVGATGQLQNQAELEKYRQIGRRNLSMNNDPSWYRVENTNEVKTLEYRADSVHDFAWFADKDFIIQYDTLQLASGRDIDVFSYHRAEDENWKNSISFIKDAVKHYSLWIGEYLYPVVSAVEGPRNTNSGGMEYPMITLISNSQTIDLEQLDDVIAHEVGHNWFYGILGTNERDHPWMDEGINTYYEFRYEAEKYRNNTTIGFRSTTALRNLGEDDVLSAIYGRINQLKKYQAIENPATAFDSEVDYAVVVYAKTALWMYIMEKSIGKEQFDRAMRAYFNDWKFKHPYPEDMQTSLEKETHIGFKALFALLHTKGPFN
jgi:Peptidase family M1 domain